jgi:hypothetical protein
MGHRAAEKRGNTQSRAATDVDRPPRARRGVAGPLVVAPVLFAPGDCCGLTPSGEGRLWFAGGEMGGVSPRVPVMARAGNLATRAPIIGLAHSGKMQSGTPLGVTERGGGAAGASCAPLPRDGSRVRRSIRRLVLWPQPSPASSVLPRTRYCACSSSRSICTSGGASTPIRV